jgi:hypothetical protein
VAGIVIAVGFTGSRHGITQAQAEEVERRLRILARVHGAQELHHGDCVEADETAARCAAGLGWRTVAHPPNNPTWRAWHPSDEVREPLPFLDRDRAIVAATAVLVGCPRSPEAADRRSGTWYTIRRARAAGIGLVVIAPSGILVEAYRPSALPEVATCTS